MSEMINRVALAIYVANNHTADSWDREPAQYIFLNMAKAAIIEMRIPTDAMCNVGYAVEDEDDGTEHVSIVAWKKMNQEALK